MRPPDKGGLGIVLVVVAIGVIAVATVVAGDGGVEVVAVVGVFTADTDDITEGPSPPVVGLDKRTAGRFTDRGIPPLSNVGGAGGRGICCSC